MSIKNNKSELVGTITCYFSNLNKICDVGILVGNKKYKSKGLGYEAWIGIINFLKKNYNLKKISSGTVKGNFQMLRIFKKSGMKYDGYRKKSFYMKKLTDIIFYAKYL